MDAINNYTPAQAREIGFDPSTYTPADTGCFIGTLVMKIYGDDFSLRCYFDAPNGRKLRITAWKNRRTGKYGPPQRLSARGSGIDFQDIPLQTNWGILVKKNKAGKLFWSKALDADAEVDYERE
jgi:hypothetical protein